MLEYILGIRIKYREYQRPIKGFLAVSGHDGFKSREHGWHIIDI